MKITVKKMLSLGFGGALLFTATLGVLGYTVISRQCTIFTDLVENDGVYMALSSSIKAEILQCRRSEKDFFLNIGSPDKQKSYMEAFQKANATIRDHTRQIDELTQTDPHIAPDFREKTSRLLPLIEKYAKGFEQTAMATNEDPSLNPQQANLRMARYKESIHETEALIDEIADKGNEMFQTAATTAMNQGLFMKGLVLVLAIIGVIAGMLFSFLISSRIHGKLSRMVVKLNFSSSQITLASGQIAAGSHQIAEGASQQAAAIEQTSAALEEMASITRQNAENAGRANGLMKEASHIVEKARQSMTQLNGSITEIKRASEETQDIIRKIDEIAFQTNLLALNAAVEAARAGESGAGFAVVADEVRHLAMRATEASKSTSGLIETTVAKVGQGFELVKKTNDEFASLAKGVLESEKLVAEITEACMEQAEGVEQVNKAVVDLDRVIQENAANSEESASSARQMNQSVEDMEELVVELVDLVGRMEEKNAQGGQLEEEAPRRPPVRVANGTGHAQSGARATNGNRVRVVVKTGRAQSPKDPTREMLIPLGDEF